jgi:hypothetical protein
MDKKILLMIVAIIILIVAAGGLWFLFTYLNYQAGCIQVITWAKNFQSGEIKAFSTPCDVPQEWTKINNYYANLAEQCKNKQSKGCCLSSVTAMEKEGYTLAENDICPKGFKINQGLCIDSFVWCEPAGAYAAEDWKTYKNNAWGVQFKYPESWIVQDAETGNSNYNLGVLYASAAQMAVMGIDYCGANPQVSRCEGGIDWDDNHTANARILNPNGSAIFLQLQKPAGQTLQTLSSDDKATFKSVLSTFKFIKQ